jgi:hypothetical protein
VRLHPCNAAILAAANIGVQDDRLRSNRELCRMKATSLEDIKTERTLRKQTTARAFVMVNEIVFRPTKHLKVSMEFLDVDAGPRARTRCIEAFLRKHCLLGGSVENPCLRSSSPISIWPQPARDMGRMDGPYYRHVNRTYTTYIMPCCSTRASSFNIEHESRCLRPS